MVPICLKSSTIVPVFKKSTMGCLIDSRPIVLNPIVNKCFKGLIFSPIKAAIPVNLDPHQFT